jgi:23S rRNA (adenine2503-C2)-methyltransferase
MHSLADFDLCSLEALFKEWGHKPVHARRLLRAFYDASGEIDLDRLDLGNALRDRLRRDIALRRSRVIAARRSADGTQKLLVGFDTDASNADGNAAAGAVAGAAAGGAVEAVLMPSHREGRAAGCVSSQVGCAMGCDFCASTRGGLERSLESGEIVEQFLHLRHAAARLGRRVTSLVFMGMGEPMHNLDNVLAAIRRIAGGDAGCLGWRAITVSTVGVVPGIDRLAGAGLNVNLAVSLHAPDDATRSRIVPSNRRYPVAEVMDATMRFAAQTGRIPTIEYCMLAGVNDSPGQARLLADLVGAARVHVNLIPYNPIGAGVSGAVYRRPSAERLLEFLSVLRERRVVAHFRDTRGDDVDAACGQLRERSARSAPAMAEVPPAESASLVALGAGSPAAAGSGGGSGGGTRRC